MGERMRVQVTVDTDELRQWAERHADAGNHGVAHVLFKAASDAESLSDQAIREAKEEALEAFARREHEMAMAWGGDLSWLTTGSKVAALVADWAREEAACLREQADPAAALRAGLAGWGVEG